VCGLLCLLRWPCWLRRVSADQLYGAVRWVGVVLLWFVSVFVLVGLVGVAVRSVSVLRRWC